VLRVGNPQAAIGRGLGYLTRFRDQADHLRLVILAAFVNHPRPACFVARSVPRNGKRASGPACAAGMRPMDVGVAAPQRSELGYPPARSDTARLIRRARTAARRLALRSGRRCGRRRVPRNAALRVGELLDILQDRSCLSRGRGVLDSRIFERDAPASAAELGARPSGARGRHAAFTGLTNGGSIASCRIRNRLRFEEPDVLPAPHLPLAGQAHIAASFADRWESHRRSPAPRRDGGGAEDRDAH